MEQITNKKSAVDNEVANGNQLSSLPVLAKILSIPEEK